MANMMENIIWKPHKGSQFDFLTCPLYEVLLEGTRGGGKTDALLMSYYKYVGRGFGENWRGIIFRLTYPQLADLIAKSKKWFLPTQTATFNSTENFWEFKTGEKLYFRYGDKEDDYWNYHGHEYPFIGFEELTNWRKSNFYEAMLSCCRSSHPNMPRMIRATTNPYGRGYIWVKERFGLGEKERKILGVGEKKRVAIHSDIRENTTLLTNDPSYLDMLKSIKDINRRKAWLEGSWDINFGAFFDGVFDKQKHIIKPFVIPNTWKIWRSMDWGYAAPYAVYWFAKDNDGCVYVWRELYGKGEKDGEGSKENAQTVAKKIKKIEQHDERNGYEYSANPADASIFANGTRQYGINESIERLFRAEGVKWVPAWNAKGSRVNGWQLIIKLLSENKLKIFDICDNIIRTLPILPPDADNPEDIDTDTEDHALDSLRYGLMHYHGAPIKVEEKIEQDVWNNNKLTIKEKKWKTIN